MSPAARYAIYYAPRPDSRLWSLGSGWIGRDAATGTSVERPALPALTNCNLDRLTAAPRHYGFHGTLKAPFEPVPEFDEAELRRAVREFAAPRAPFEVSLEVAQLGDFLALRSPGASPELEQLHRDCVRELDPFRAPLRPDDLARRRRRRLTPEQEAYLARWGYPYIFEYFRFHMTLTARMASRSSRAMIRDALADLFAPVLVDPLVVDGIALFAQSDREAPFMLLDWFPFDGSVPRTEV